MSRIILVLAAVTTLALVGGQLYPYEIVIEFHQYSNPSHALITGDCCDNSTCIDDCNSALALCIGSGGTNFSNSTCPVFFGVIGGDSVTFTDCVGDEENPVVLRANILPHTGYQLFIESSAGLGVVQFFRIDQTSINIPSAFGQCSPPQNYSGKTHAVLPVTITLSYCLRCSPNYTMCTVNNVKQCVHECECINGSAPVPTPMPQTVLLITIPESPPDGNSSSKCIATVNVTPTSTSDFTPSTTTDTTETETPNPDSGGTSVAVIAGAVLGALALVVLIVVLVVVGVAVFFRGGKKESGHTASTPSNMGMHGEDGNCIQGNTYESLETNLNTERAMSDRGNAIQPNTIQPNTIRPESTPPVYAVLERPPHVECSSTQVELPNPMYDDTTMQQNEQPEYQETQRDVNNVLYSSTMQQNEPTEYQETQREVKNILYA